MMEKTLQNAMARNSNPFITIVCMMTVVLFSVTKEIYICMEHCETNL
jgi:hypothetical protein